ncbi:type II toxin-antitoxin system VapC family toxin [Aquihabitans sp. G128]|nr:type II toxin-antitoxin system VapC family toxin [Aquihabitans sp. G128]
MVPLDQGCLDRAAELTREHPLRTVDALHLAAATRLPGPVTFVTFDPRQIPVALALGLPPSPPPELAAGPARHTGGLRSASRTSLTWDFATDWLAGPPVGVASCHRTEPPSRPLGPRSQRALSSARWVRRRPGHPLPRPGRRRARAHRAAAPARLGP